MSVAILMSTYNGEQYLSEQIESIEKQNYADWHLYIRDDGSSDSTRKIIDHYAQKNPRITFFDKDRQTNLGVTGSFFRMLNHTSADFYMFCDQDDVWLPDKVSSAVDELAKLDKKEPLCLHTELKLVDQNLNPQGLMVNDNHWTDFRRFMFGNCMTGCTMVINDTLKQKLNLDRIDILEIYLHDRWIALVAAALGKIVYDDQPRILYRQHSDNVVGYEETGTVKSDLHRAMNIDREVKFIIESLNLLQQFKENYGSELRGQIKQYVEAYGSLSQNSSFMHNLKVVMTLPPKRTHLKGQLLMSYLIVKYWKQIR